MNTNFIQNSRLVFQKMDAGPKAPESFKSPEKQTEAAMINEVASKTPSEIYNDTVSAGGAVAARHTGNTQILAALANVNPLGGSGGGGGTSDDGSGTTTSDDGTIVVANSTTTQQK